MPCHGYWLAAARVRPSQVSGRRTSRSLRETSLSSRITRHYYDRLQVQAGRGGGGGGGGGGGSCAGSQFTSRAVLPTWPKQCVVVRERSWAAGRQVPRIYPFAGYKKWLATSPPFLLSSTYSGYCSDLHALQRRARTHIGVLHRRQTSAPAWTPCRERPQVLLLLSHAYSTCRPLRHHQRP